MKCTNCNKIPTTNPDGICGFCRLKDTLADYVDSNKAYEVVMQMPVDQRQLDWQHMVDEGDRSASDYAG